MQKRKFYAFKQSYLRWLKLAIILISFAAVGWQCQSDKVTTTRDDKGVWLITGSEHAKLYDVFEAMGYAVATDRLWQAETFRRSAHGRLAEIFGASQLAQDKLVRITGYSDQELQDGFSSLGREEQDVINGYVAGFNRRIAEIRKNPSLLPFEFSAVGITNVTLEDWTYKDVLAWASLMMRNFDCEAQATGQIDNAALYQGLMATYGAAQGTRMFEDLRWVNDPDALTYIPKPLMVSRAQISTEAILTPLMENPPSLPDLGEVAKSMAETRSQIDENLKKINAYVKMGSYAWAIKGSKTASGNPILYSGPQMGFTVPSVIGEGSIMAGGLNVSGMIIAGLPAIVIGRTPHHAWSMQVGHAHTVDYYLESSLGTLNRTDTIKVAGGPDVFLPIYRTTHGPVVNASPVISWKYSQWGYEFKVIKAYLGLARATSMDEFGAAIELVPLSQHYTYADKDGNIAYWMSGRDPARPFGEWRLPQGAVGIPQEWDSANLISRSTDRNTSQGYYCGWNNKTNAGYANPPNNISYSFGPFHRAHVIDDYLSTNNNLTFEQVRDLALNIATTDSIGSGGNPWKFVSAYFIAAVKAHPTTSRSAALDLLATWDGHFVNGGVGSWAAGTDRADAWVLMDTWIKEVLNLTFEELNALPANVLPAAKNNLVLFNVLLHGLNPGGGIQNNYNWFQNSDPKAPQTADAIIVQALDNTLVALGAKPWGLNKRGVITYNHTLLGPVHQMPFSSRSTYAHVIEYARSGPVKLQSMFPLGESGTILGYPSPVFDANFFSMTSVFDGFVYRDFPFKP